MVKSHPEALAEAEYLVHLGEIAAPRVLTVVSPRTDPLCNFQVGRHREPYYVMEHLTPAVRHRRLLLEIESVLERFVWSRPARGHQFRVSSLRDLVGRSVPDDVLSRPLCLTHGDPTVANALVDGERLVLGDARPPRSYTPEMMDVDRGKILQSALGWEIVERGETPVEWDPPKFWDAPADRARAMFWCGVACRRIHVRETARTESDRRLVVLDWSSETARRCFREAGI